MLVNDTPNDRHRQWPLAVGDVGDVTSEERAPGTTVPNTMGREALVVVGVTAALVTAAIITQGWLSIVLWVATIPGALWLAHIVVVLVMGYAVRRWFDSLSPKKD